MKRKMNRLKLLLKINHMTQQDFADWFCIARFTAWQVLNEKRQLKGDEIIEICKRFKVSADWLLGLSEIENPAAQNWIVTSGRKEAEGDSKAAYQQVKEIS